MTKSLSDTSLSLLIDKAEFSTSKVAQGNESTDIALKNLAKNVTDNRAFRKKKFKQQNKVNIDTGKETDSDNTLLADADRVKKPAERVVDLSQINSELLAGENRSSKMDTSPPNLCSNSAHISSESGSPDEEKNEPLFCTQDKELLSILEKQEQVQSTSITNSDRISGYFCSDTVFNLSKKGLDYAPIQNKINEPELRRHFEDFVRRMRLKWYFRNEPTSSFSERPSFSLESSWKPPKGNPSLELFLSQIEKNYLKSASPI